MTVFGQLLRIALGYIAATIAAAVVVAAGGGVRAAVPAGAGRVFGEVFGETGDRLVLGLADIAATGFPTPGFLAVFVVAIVASEAWSLRSVWVWLVVGGIAGAGLAVSAVGDGLAAFVAAGFVAGFVYWLVAGRHAGAAWRTPTPD